MVGETTPKHVFIGIIFGLIIIISGISLLSWSVSQNTNSMTQTELQALNNTFQNNIYTTVQDQVYNLNSSISTATANAGFFGMIESLINVAWNSLKSMFSSIGFALVFMTGVSSYMHINPFIVGLLFSVLIVMLAFWIILIFRRA
jgi:hypothetical protein